MKLHKGLMGSTLAVIGFSIAAPVLAACPPQLSAEEQIECIRVEGAGYNYMEYKAEREQAMRDARASAAASERARSDDAPGNITADATTPHSKY